MYSFPRRFPTISPSLSKMHFEQTYNQFSNLSLFCNFLSSQIVLLWYDSEFWAVKQEAPILYSAWLYVKCIY